MVCSNHSRCAYGPFFPGDLLSPTYDDPQKKNKLKARNELQRRENSVTTLEEKFGKKHSLVVIIKDCLENEAHC